MQEFDEIWNYALDELGKSFSAAFMNVWFKDTRLVSLTETAAIIYVPSDLKRGMLEKNQSGAIADALESIIGYRAEPIFTNDENSSAVPEAVFEEEEPVTAEQEPEPSFFTQGQSVQETTESHSMEYTFDNFIVGSSNKFAHAACLAVAKSPANSYNPLFIYGPSGLGKTHLLYAIINEIHKERPSFKIIYVKGDEFTNQMIESITKNKTEEFRERFRKADVLLIDDIHFIAGKEATQEEFFHTFNDLHAHKKQIILTSDRPARDISKLEERLRSRFEWGLNVDIQPPDFELRVAIMRKKAEGLSTVIPGDVLNFLAEKLTNNVRQMEGAIKRIIAFSRLNGEAITVALVNDCISDLLSTSNAVRLTPEKIISKVAEKYSISEADILGNKRTSNIMSARHISIYVIKKTLDLSFKAIGKLFQKDHATIMHSYKQTEKDIKNDSTFEIEINDFIKELSQ